MQLAEMSLQMLLGQRFQAVSQFLLFGFSSGITRSFLSRRNSGHLYAVAKALILTASANLTLDALGS